METFGRSKGKNENEELERDDAVGEESVEQLSPSILERGKHHDREFLQRFQSHKKVLEPEGLGDIPDFVFNEELHQRPMMKSVNTDTKINKANEKWKLPHADAKSNSEKYADETEKLCRTVNSILDQLTPKTFQVLVKLMQTLPVKSETELKGVVDLVYERAVREANTTVVLANACRCLSMLKVPSDSKPGEMVNYRGLLLTRCQREFEKKEPIEALSVSEREETEKAEHEEKREELKQEFMREVNKRKVGNVRLIGELFKLKMLTENIMHDCVYKLLRTRLPTDLECVCTLLTIIGKELDVAKAKSRMDQYFQEMRKLVSETSIPPRVRLMLQDVVDLRTDSWVPRSLVKSPKIKGASEAQKTTSVSEQVGGEKSSML